MSDATKDPKPEAEKSDLPASAPESAAEGHQTDAGPQTAADPAEATPAPAGAAGDGPQHEPATDATEADTAALYAAAEADAVAESDPPVDDRVAKGKGDKARAATLGQVPAPKPKPVKETPVPEIAEDEQVIRTRAFPGPLLAFGGRARRQGWAPGFEITAQNATDRTGRNMKLMITGHRAGPIEWKPEHLADELVADDWEVIVPNDQMETFLSIQRGEANPSSEAGPA